MDDQIPEHLRTETLDMSSFVTVDDNKKGRKLALEYAMLKLQIDDYEEKIKQWKVRKLELERKEIPEFFDNVLKVDKLGLPEAGVDVEVKPFYHANIKADWPEDQRKRGFKALDDAGHGDVVKCVLSIEFDKGDYEDAKEIERLILDSKWGNQYDVEIVETVPWNTLTAIVKKDVENGKKVDLEALGATVGRAASIKKRK
jgi:hypothetical protein